MFVAFGGKQYIQLDLRVKVKPIVCNVIAVCGIFFFNIFSKKSKETIIMNNSPFLKFISVIVFIFTSVGFAIAQVDVPRKTTAITYPLDDLVFVQFRGTT